MNGEFTTAVGITQPVDHLPLLFIVGVIRNGTAGQFPCSGNPPGGLVTVNDGNTEDTPPKLDEAAQAASSAKAEALAPKYRTKMLRKT